MFWSHSFLMGLETRISRFSEGGGHQCPTQGSEVKIFPSFQSRWESALLTIPYSIGNRRPDADVLIRLSWVNTCFILKYLSCSHWCFQSSITPWKGGRFGFQIVMVENTCSWEIIQFLWLIGMCVTNYDQSIVKYIYSRSIRVIDSNALVSLSFALRDKRLRVLQLKYVVRTSEIVYFR